MPKEKYNDRAGYATLNLLWGKWDRTVEFGLELNRGAFASTIDQIRRRGDDDPDDSVENWKGLWISLNEEQMIDLERSIRKARKQAFG